MGSWSNTVLIKIYIHWSPMGVYERWRGLQNQPLLIIAGPGAKVSIRSSLSFRIITQHLASCHYEVITKTPRTRNAHRWWWYWDTDYVSTLNPLRSCRKLRSSIDMHWYFFQDVLLKCVNPFVWIPMES